MSATGGRTPPSKITFAVLGVSIIAAIWAAAMLTPAGKKGYVYFFSYCLYYMGVVSLVSLSITIMLGLVATDRLVLSIRQRVLLQSAHRTTGVIAVASLFVHVWTKVAMNLVGVIDVFIPFLLPYNGLFIGFGSVSAYVMVLVMWTGLARSRFIGKGKPWMWRGIHAISYLMWPLALMHGLNAGRPAATWVTVSYVVCVLGVLVGLAVRLSVSLNRRKDFASQAGTGTGKIQPVGKLVPTSTPSIKSRGKSRRDDAVAPAAVEAWTPAAGAGPRASGAPALSELAAKSVSAAPPGPAPQAERRPRRGVDDDERARRRRDYDDAPTQRWEFEEDDMPAPRSRRYADDEAPAPRQRRAAEPERFDEPTRAMSRRAVEDGPRGYAEDDDMPAPRGRRRADEDYVDERPPARSRRYAGTEFEQEPAPISRGRRYADEDEAPAPRGRRVAEEDAARPRRYADGDDIPAPRQRRYPDEERYEEAPPRRRSARYADDEPPRPSRSSRYSEDAETAPRARRDRGAQIDSADPDYLEADETPTLVDMASRRARRATQLEPARTASRGARRGGKGGDESADDQYWRQLRGEAQ
ncbi:translation initiation factor III [Actinoplanes sp. NPDC049118]|uniref:translation initiation factor III n=1 Tax=Actinoplanes sp. NPDC049118 TaxID=3155769 RepID=UPI0033ECE4B1